MEKIGFYSDNCAPVHQKVMDYMARANTGHAPSYGDDGYCTQVLSQIERMLGGDCKAHFVLSGTGANVAALASLCPAFGSILCSNIAHINTSECGGVERASGARLVYVPVQNGKVTPAQFEPYIPYIGNYIKSQPTVLSITQTTEDGTVYSLSELRELADFAHKHGLLLHMDGARFANAVAALGCTPAALTSEIGLDALSLGMTKNGSLFGEAVVFFGDNPHFKSASKATGQVAPKARFIAAQFDAMLDENLWLQSAKQANNAAKTLSEALSGLPGVAVQGAVEANAVFATLPKEILPRLHEQIYFMDWKAASGLVRFMCAYDVDAAAISHLVSCIKALL